MCRYGVDTQMAHLKVALSFYELLKSKQYVGKLW